MENEVFELLVDDRELKSQTARKLFTLGVKLKAQRLNIGDFVVSERIVVERKTMADFEASVIDGRLFQQALSLRQSFSSPLIAVIGNDKVVRIKESAFLGAIFSLMLDLKVPVLFLENEDELAEALFLLAKREAKEKRPLPTQFQKPKGLTSAERQLFVVEALPNIGPQLARNLLLHFKTLRKLFSSHEEELQNVDGVGEEKARRIVEIVNKEFENSGL